LLSIFGLMSLSLGSISLLDSLGGFYFSDRMTATLRLAKALQCPGLHSDASLCSRRHVGIKRTAEPSPPHTGLAPRVAAKAIGATTLISK
jgi:hypothetical protein